VLFVICALFTAAILRHPILHASDQPSAARRARLLQGIERSKYSYATRQLLVRFRPGTSEESKARAHAMTGAVVLKRFESVSGLEKIQVPSGTTVETAVAQYRALPTVEYAEPNYIVHALQNPDDPYFPQQWSLHNTGQTGGASGADIHALQAWDITKGSSNVVISVIDSGMDYTHPDLTAQVWTAANSYSVTDTQGAVVNCPSGSHGFDAVNGTCTPMDDLGHGTHVSGIIGASTNNNVGIAGISWNLQILPCKFLDAQGSGTTADAITCLDFVNSLKDSGLNIVATNNSWGGPAFSQALQDAISANQQSGILFVAAAGNSFEDNDLTPTYPADYALPNIISVASSTATDQFSSFSNVGRRTTYITAPGEQILSTTPNNTYAVLSGTSMAAPHVTGVAALLAAQDSSRDWRAIKNLLLAGGDNIAALSSTVTGKRLNAAGALSCSNSIVQSRLLPIPDTVGTTAGTPVTFEALSINCANSVGPVTATVSPGGQTLTLVDDGTNGDQVSGDGIFTTQWTPPASGSYTVTFPWGDAVQIEVLNGYSYSQISSSYTAITGTNLNLGDDAVVQISSPFPIQYGGGSFSNLYVSSNGTISFTDAFDDYVSQLLPITPASPAVLPVPTTLVAPWWQDLYPVQGSAQNVFWAVNGSAPYRQLIVEWRDVRSFQCSSDAAATIKFQAVFFEGKSDVQFNYADTTFGDSCSAQDHGAVASIGLQQSLSSAQMYSYYQQTVGDGFSILWTVSNSSPAANPSPVATSVSPASAPLSSGPLTITVTGTNFVPSSHVQFNASDRVTTYVNAGTLQAQLTAADLNATTAWIQVFNPAPGGGVSSELQFSILNPVPTITSLNPSTVSAGGLSFYLTVNGTGFVWGSSGVSLNGQALEYINWINSTTITAQVPYNLISAAGTAQITVQTGTPGGGSSNSLPLTIGPVQTGSGFSSTAAATSQSLPPLEPLYVDGSGHVQTNVNPQLTAPIRFLGWNYGRKLGPAYMTHFARSHGGIAVPAANITSATNNTLSNGVQTSHAQVFSAGSSNLPGFGIRPTLPADYLPTSVATGDFNHDGKMDWAVSNGGTNSLWLYLGRGDGTAQLPVILPLAGLSPIQVIAADLRKIGVLDLIVAEADSGTIGVLLGNGDGTFQKEQTLYAPGAVLSVATGDFNGDGNLDIVGGLAGGLPLVVFAGDGKGGFSDPIVRPPETPIASYATVNMQTADMNRDGVPDLIVTDQGGVVNGAQIYLSMGDGTFKESDAFIGDTPAGNVLNAAAGDMDGDGCPDVVVSTDSGYVYLFHGNCDGTVQGFPNVLFYGSGDAGAGLALADVNGDGHLDVVISGILFDVGYYGPPTGDAVAVLLGDGQGHLSPGKLYRGEPGMYNLAIADVNGDGKPDILTANQDTDTASVYLNNGNGGFGDPVGGYVGYSVDGTTSGSINSTYAAAAVVDVNGDGKPDIVFVEVPLAANVYSWKLCTMLNDGTGHFGPVLRSDAMDGNLIPYDVQFVDVRGTGKPDLLVLGGYMDVGVTPFLGFAPNRGDGTFGPLKLTPMPDLPSIFAAGDFNGDGKIDVVLAGATGQTTTGLTNRLTFCKGNGDGTFTVGSKIDFGPAGITGGGPRLSFVADFNGDGKLDVIVAVNDGTIGPNSLNHPAFEFLGNGDGTFQAPVIVIPNVASMSMADLNNDGHPDFVEWVQPVTTAGFNTPIYKVHLGQPDGSFVDGQTYSPFGGKVAGLSATSISPMRLAAPILADVNGDGNVDILVSQRYPGWDSSGNPVMSQGYFQILLGNGDGTFTPDFSVFALDKIFLPSTAADVNGDGRADLIDLDAWPSSYNVILSSSPTTIQAALVADPVLGNTGTLHLNLGVAAASPTTVTLTASDPNISIAPSVTVAPGNAFEDVPFTIGSGFNPLHVFSLTATLGSVSATAYGSVAMPGSNAGFQINLNNSSESAGPGGTTNDYSPNILSVNGYTTNVQLQCQGLPRGATCQTTASAVPVLPGTVQNPTLTVSVPAGVALGSYPFTVIATDGVVTAQTSATLVVSDFSVSITPASQITSPGQVGNFNLVLSSLAGWNQQIQISCPVSPVGPKCLSDGLSLFPGNYTLGIDPQSAPLGSYTVNITANGAGVIHTATAQLSIENATISVSKTSATIAVGSSTTLNVSLTSLNGYSDQFFFSCPNLPAGLACTFSPAAGTLPSNGTLTSTATIAVNSRPASTITATSSGPTVPAAIPLLYVFTLALAIGCALVSMTFTAQFRWNRLVYASVLSAAVVLASCGGGGSSSSTSPSNPSPPTSPPSSPTVVQFQVQASSTKFTATSGNITLTIP
jgi:subtilisin family serine protease